MSDANFLLDIWAGIRDALPPAKREEVAHAVVRAFADHGYDGDDLMAVADEDDDLGEALATVFEDADEDDGDEDEGYEDRE